MRTKVYKTIKGLASQTSQLTAQEIINGRFCHKVHSWVNFKLTEEEMEKFYQDIAGIISGNKKDVVLTALKYKHPSHWALKRIIWSNDIWSYYAGQDYTYEMNQLRKYLYNL